MAEEDRSIRSKMKKFLHLGRHPSAPSSRSSTPAPSPTPVSRVSNISVDPNTNQSPLIEAPWEKWEVDNEFLQTLQKWNASKPESSLDQVMKKVQEKLSKVANFTESEAAKAAMELIPNDPFPAGTLVKGLVSVMVIGVRIPEVKKKAFNFAMDVVEDVNRMAVAFGKGTASDDLLVESWSDLETMRDIVDEICEWAYQTTRQKIPLESDVTKVMQEFKERSDRSRARFLALGTIRHLRALSELNGKLDQVLEARVVAERMEFIKETLKNRLSTRATYDQQQDLKDECHEATRDRILARIDDWFSAPSDSNSPKRCWWITGQPGVGKSAIAITVAKCLTARQSISAHSQMFEEDQEPRAKLAGQFFINYTLPDCGSQHFVFPTIALQLATTSPVAAVLIQDALKRNLTLANEFSEQQVDALFVKPLLAIARHDPGIVVTLFDGIDELANGDGAILSRFTSILTKATAHLPSNVKVLAFSRPESYITARLRDAPSVFGSDLLTEESRQDVQRFFQAKLPEIAELNQLQDWPMPESIDLLCECAAGHLGWASLAIRWIGREVEAMGNTPYVRGPIFESVKAVRQGSVYDLYQFILERVIPENAVTTSVEGCQATLGCLVTVEHPETIGTIIAFLSLESFDVLHFFRRISSIVINSMEPIVEDTIPRPHKSFIDWICSSYPHPRFRIQAETHHEIMASRCLDILKSSLHFNMLDIETSDPFLGRQYDENDELPSLMETIPRHVLPQRQVQYACFAVLYHLCNTRHLVATILDEVETFFKNFVLPWMEVVCVIQVDHPVDIQGNLKLSLDTFIPDDRHCLRALVTEAASLMDDFSSAIVHPAHLYVSVLPFSSLILSHSRDLYPHILHVKHMCSDDDEPPIQRMQEAAVEGKYVMTMAEGPEGFYTLKVFEFILDPGSGRDLFSLSLDSKIFRLEGRDGYEPLPAKDPVTISRDGKIVAVGRWRCDVFNIERHSSLSLIPPYEYAEITCLQISSDCERVVAGHRGGRLHEWELSSGKSYRTFQSAPVPIGPDDEHIVAWAVYMGGPGDMIISNNCTDKYSDTFEGRGFSSTIRVWRGDGSCSCSLTVASSCIVAFFTFGMIPCIGYYDRSNLYIHEILTGEIKFKSSEVHVPPVMKAGNTWSPHKSLACSADGRLVISWDNWLCVWDCWEKKNLATLVGHSDFIAAVAFVGKPGTYQFISVSHDGTIRLWDLQPLLRGDLVTTEKEITSWSIKEVQRTHWITNNEGEILFCHAESYPFRHPLNTAIIGKYHELDPTDFVYGKEWTKCREPINAEVSSREVKAK